MAFVPRWNITVLNWRLSVHHRKKNLAKVAAVAKLQHGKVTHGKRQDYSQSETAVNQTQWPHISSSSRCPGIHQVKMSFSFLIFGAQHSNAVSPPKICHVGGNDSEVWTTANHLIYFFIFHKYNKTDSQLTYAVDRESLFFLKIIFKESLFLLCVKRKLNLFNFWKKIFQWKLQFQQWSFSFCAAENFCALALSLCFLGASQQHRCIATLS